jgi:hypothetical protein
MRDHAPRAGAHGLVLAHVSGARAEAASLTFTWLYPRILGNGVGQAERIRNAALAAASTLEPVHQALQREVLRGVKTILDPAAILNPPASP